MTLADFDISDIDMETAGVSVVPDLRKCAILLDIDGTILDLAPSPQQVWVPTGLRQTLARLGELTGGALAMVSGRSLGDIDLIFSPLQFAAIGGHGAELRPVAGAEPTRRAPPLDGPRWSNAARTCSDAGSRLRCAHGLGAMIAWLFELPPSRKAAVNLSPMCCRMSVSHRLPQILGPT